MPKPQRPNLTDPATLDALAHPVRLDVLGYLMSSGPATASECARAVGDTPSNCSYHLRVLASHHLVETTESTDARTRPWRATITGFTTDPERPTGGAEGEGTQGEGTQSDEAHGDGAEDLVGLDGMVAASLELDHQLARDHFRHRHDLPPEWRDAGFHGGYGLRVTPAELADLTERLDGILRPFIVATRDDAPEDARYVQVALTAFPRPGFDRRPGAGDQHGEDDR